MTNLWVFLCVTKGIQCSIDATPNTPFHFFHILNKFLHKLSTTFHVDRKNKTTNDNCKCKSILCFYLCLTLSMRCHLVRHKNHHFAFLVFKTFSNDYNSINIYEAN